jgi:hypothetical protein
MLLIITGIFDAGRAVWQENTLAYAAREGTRYAIVNGSGCQPNPSCIVFPGNRQPVIDRVRAAAVGVPNVTVDVQWPDQPGGTACYDRNCTVVVDARAQFVPIPSQYLLGGTFNFTLRGGSKLVIQR